MRKTDYATFMEISPTPDQEAFIRQAIEAGRIAQPEEAVIQALAMWEEVERRRAEILARMEEAEHSIAEGRGVLVDKESMMALPRRPR